LTEESERGNQEGTVERRGKQKQGVAKVSGVLQTRGEETKRKTFLKMP